MKTKRTKTKRTTRRGFGSPEAVHRDNAAMAETKAGEAIRRAKTAMLKDHCETAFAHVKTAVAQGAYALADADSQSDAEVRRSANMTWNDVTAVSFEFSDRCLRRKS